MDSATLLAQAIDESEEVIPVTFIYGSNHNKFEIDFGMRFARNLKLVPYYVNVSSVFSNMRSALLGNSPIPEGHYEEESMKQTVIPGRNTIFLAILAGIAESKGFDEVWIGAHAGDHAIYPDCRPEFLSAMGEAIQLGTDHKVRLKAPFAKMKKCDIVARGAVYDVDYSLTRTCYKHQVVACGKCGSCQERLEAFQIVGVEDPIEYQSRELMPKNS